MDDRGPTGDDEIAGLVPLLDGIFTAAARFGSLPEAEQEALLALDDAVIADKTVEIFRDQVAQGRRLRAARERAEHLGWSVAPPSPKDRFDWGAAAAGDLMCRMMACGVVSVSRRLGEDPVAHEDWAGTFCRSFNRMAAGQAAGSLPAVISPALPTDDAPVALDTILASSRADDGAGLAVVVASAPPGEPGRLLVSRDGSVLAVHPAATVEAVCRSGLASEGPEPGATIAGADAVLRILIVAGR